ncbi:MAG: UvrD-helicase domain-containing protein [Spirochaetales bacterium]|nr:UvrD-helicase domain-containing protein [Spirochaetales bacterium]
MKAEEIALIQSKHNAAIVAPAGHGKTEMITDLVDKLPGKKLVLTHTNAGVDALQQRMNRKNISKEKYYLSTISSFCMKWCDAYPQTAGVDSAVKMTDNKYYPMVHAGAIRIFQNEWARKVIGTTYSCVIIDEYQDCVLAQHQIFVELNKTLPVYVLGDPLQAIFGFKEKLVSWKNLCFEVTPIKTYPWRWEKTNPALGQYLNDVRTQLLPGLDGQHIRLSTVPNSGAVHRIGISALHDGSIYKIANQYETVLYIAKWEPDTIAFSKGTGGLFQHDETQSLKILYEASQLLDTDDGYARANTIYDFIGECASGIATELKSYEGHIKDGDFDFSRIKKHPEFGKRMARLYKYHGHNDMMAVLDWIKNEPGFRIHRRELFTEMQRSIRRARDLNIPIAQAAQEIRMITGNQSKYAGFKRLASRTLLSKGLEFDCVIIDLSKVAQNASNRYSSTEMYVAMTRAMKAIYFITDQDSVLLNVPQGI